MVGQSSAKRGRLMIESSLSLEDLPDDLVVEILCRLPQRCVIQCMCVSKRWFSLISKPKFVCRFIGLNVDWEQARPWAFMCFTFTGNSERIINSHPDPVENDIDTNTPRLMSESMYSEYFNSRGFSLSFLPREEGDYESNDSITVIKTSNDLILLCRDKLDQSQLVFYICNPRTEQWVALPPTPQLPSNPTGGTDIELFCEPYYTLDEDRQLLLKTRYRFKVLRIATTSSTRFLQIFSSRTRQWTVIRVSTALAIKRSFLCNGNRLTCLVRDLNGGISTITFHGRDELHAADGYRINFPGSRFCRSNFYSLLHLSSCRGKHIRIAQTSIYLGNHPNNNANYGVPILRIWLLNLAERKWELKHEAGFRQQEIEASSNWLRDYYLKERAFVTNKENGMQKILHLPIVLGFHPYKSHFLYLNLNCEEKMALYSTRNRELNFASTTWPRPSILLDPITWSPSLPTKFKFTDVSNLFLPLWPTPLPQI